MLGVKSIHAPLRGESARRFLEKLVRMQTGNLNSEDRKDLEEIRKRRQELPTIEWPNLMPTE